MLHGMSSHRGESYGADAALLTRGQVAGLLGCSPRTVVRLAERGELPSVHIGRLVRFRPADVETLINAARSELGTCRARRQPGPEAEPPDEEEADEM